METFPALNSSIVIEKHSASNVTCGFIQYSDIDTNTRASDEFLIDTKNRDEQSSNKQIGREN